MKQMKNLLCAGLALVMMLALTACGGGSGAASTPAEGSAAASGSATATGESDLAYVQGNGKLIVGITDFAPMDYKEKDSDEWVGFDADMARAFAESIGVEAEFLEIDWDNKIMELDSKGIDCVWNGMTLTDEVKNAMETSAPYCDNAQIVVVNKDKAADITNTDSLKNLSIAVESGSAGEAEVQNLGLEPTAVQAQADAVMEVASGSSDACVIDSLMAGATVGEGTDYPDLVATIKLNSEEYGVGFRKGSDLAAKLDEFVTAGYADGTVQEIAEKYGVQDALITK